MTDDRPLRILSLAPTSFFNDYGCHVRILEEARALQRRGHEVTVVTYFKGGDLAGLRIIRTNPTPWHANYEVGSSRHKFAFDALLAFRLARVLARNNFDVIHGHLHEGALIGGVVGRLFGVPTVMDFQGSLTDEMLQHGFIRPDGLREAFWHNVERIAERLTKTIFTSTGHAAVPLRARHTMPIVELQDGVSTTFVRPDVISAADRAVARSRYGITPDAPIVIFLGLLAAHQGIQNIIDTAALLRTQNPALRWLVLGYPAAQMWRDRAIQAGVADIMHFPGRVPYGDMPRMLALGDIAVAPKLSLTEGSGKLLNYMAMALPTVAFDTPAQREILEDCGIYAPVNDNIALGAGIQTLLDDPAAAREMGARARDRADAKFGWDAAAIRMETVYRRVMRQSVDN